MKTFLVAAISVLAVAVIDATYAADTPTKGPAHNGLALASYDWTGVYIGGSAGGARGESSFTFDNGNHPFPNPADLGKELIGGVHIGAQWHLNSFVLGVEANWYGVGLHATPLCVNGQLCDTRITQIWTIGPRLGWATGSGLLYSTGGYAAGLVKFHSGPTGFALGTETSSSSWHNGWFAGLGWEMLVPGFPDWILGIEYAHTHINGKTDQSVSANVENTFTMNIHANIDSVQARLRYKFNWMH